MDIVAYRAAASCEPTKTKAVREDEHTAIYRVDDMMNRMLKSFVDHEYIAFLSGDANFRKRKYPDYKANRTAEKPVWLATTKIHAVEFWKAKITDGYEADDAIGIHAGDGTIICSIDKDLRQIPGLHYNFVKDELVTISEQEAHYNFWAQMLIGDTSDNVFGIRGIGPVKALSLLNDKSWDEMKDIVFQIYNDEERFNKNIELLHILREEPDYETTIGESQGSTPSAVAEGSDPKEVSTIGA